MSQHSVFYFRTKRPPLLNPDISPLTHHVCFLHPPQRLLPWNEDVAAWGTLYKYGLTGYTVFTGLCGFGGIAGSKKLSVSAALRDDPCAPAWL